MISTWKWGAARASDGFCYPSGPNMQKLTGDFFYLAKWPDNPKFPAFKRMLWAGLLLPSEYTVTTPNPFPVEPYMPNRPRSHDIPPDSPDYIEKWARDLVAAVGKREARRILADYRGIADNERLARRDREVAAERAEALEELL